MSFLLVFLVRFRDRLHDIDAIRGRGHKERREKGRNCDQSRRATSATPRGANTAAPTKNKAARS